MMYVPSGAPTNDTVYFPVKPFAFTVISLEMYSLFCKSNFTSLTLIVIDGFIYPSAFAFKAPFFNLMIALPISVSSYLPAFKSVSTDELLPV